MPSRTDQRRWGANVGLLFISVLWGATFVMVQRAVAGSSVMSFLAVRFAIATVALAPFVWRARRRVDRKVIAGGLLVGVFYFAAHALQTAGLARMTPGRAGFITGLYVPLVPVLAWAILRRPARLTVWLGVIVATVGLAVLSWKGPMGLSLADWMVLGCAVACALQIVFLGKFAPDSDPAVLAMVQCVVIGVGSAILATLSGDWRVGFTAEAWQSAAFMGVVVTALVLWLQSRLQQFTPPADVALVFSTEPVFAALAGWWLVGETFTSRTVLGCGLILMGMLMDQIIPASAGTKTIVTEGADVGT